MRKCDDCRYNQEPEYNKPCVVYREDCPLYQKEGYGMTRDEAIMTLKGEAWINCQEKWLEALDVAIKALEQEPRWIPVSERLPEDKTYVLTTIKVPNRVAHARSGWYGGGYFHNDNGDTWKATDIEVKAWMPLPKPYVPQESEDEE